MKVVFANLYSPVLTGFTSIIVPDLQFHFLSIFDFPKSALSEDPFWPAAFIDWIWCCYNSSDQAIFSEFFQSFCLDTTLCVASFAAETFL